MKKIKLSTYTNPENPIWEDLISGRTVKFPNRFKKLAMNMFMADDEITYLLEDLNLDEETFPWKKDDFEQRIIDLIYEIDLDSNLLEKFEKCMD